MENNKLGFEKTQISSVLVKLSAFDIMCHSGTFNGYPNWKPIGVGQGVTVGVGCFIKFTTFIAYIAMDPADFAPCEIGEYIAEVVDDNGNIPLIGQTCVTEAQMTLKMFHTYMWKGGEFVAVSKLTTDVLCVVGAYIKLSGKNAFVSTNITVLGPCDEGEWLFEIVSDLGLGIEHDEDDENFTMSITDVSGTEPTHNVWAKDDFGRWLQAAGSRSSCLHGEDANADASDPRADLVYGPAEFIEPAELSSEHKRAVRWLVLNMFELWDRVDFGQSVAIFGRDMYPAVGFISEMQRLGNKSVQDWHYYEGVSRVVAGQFTCEAQWGVDSGFAGTIPATCCPNARIALLSASDDHKAIFVPANEHERSAIRSVVMELEHMPKPFMRATRMSGGLPEMRLSNRDDIEFAWNAVDYAESMTRHYSDLTNSEIKEEIRRLIAPEKSPVVATLVDSSHQDAIDWDQDYKNKLGYSVWLTEGVNLEQLIGGICLVSGQNPDIAKKTYDAMGAVMSAKMVEGDPCSFQVYETYQKSEAFLDHLFQIDTLMESINADDEI